MHTGLPQHVKDSTYATILTDSVSLLWKVELKTQIALCQCSPPTSCRCTALAMPEWREMTEQTDWRAKQPSQMSCISEDLKRWGVWALSASRPRTSHHWLPGGGRCRRGSAWWSWKVKKGPPSLQQTLELFQKQHWENSWEMEWSTCGLFRAHRYHIELNWTELR